MRFIDIKHLFIGGSEIVRRNPVNFGAAAAVFSVTLIIVSALTFGSSSLSVTTSVIIFGVLMVLFASVLMLLSQYNDRIYVAECQSALFSNVASTVDVAFFCIMDVKNKHIIYYSPNCRNYFNYRTSNLATSFAKFQKNLKLQDVNWEENLEKALGEQPVNIPFSIENRKRSQVQDLSLEISKIERPSGFVVLRARHKSGVVSHQKSAHTSNSSDSLKEIFDMVPLGVYGINQEGIITYLNQAASNVLEYSEDQLLGSHSLEDLQFFEGTEIVKDGKSRISLRSGTGKSVNVMLQETIREEATQLRYGFILSDSSHSSYERSSFDNAWSKFIDNAPFAIMVTDQSGHIEEGNLAFYQMVGAQSANKANLNVFEYIHEEDKNAVTELLRSALNGDGKESKPVDIRLTSQEHTHASIYITSAGEMSGEDRDKKPIFVVRLIDTTDQKSLEQKFAMGQKMQAVGQLAGGVAHDFNNLLTAMIGFCDLLLAKHNPGDDNFADIMQIKQNANRAANLVRQLLAFSRKQTLQPVAVNLTDSLAEISNLIRRLIGENIEFKMVHARDVWPIKVDVGQLEQVIVNLCVNARDAMKVSGGTLTIKTENVTVSKIYRLPADFVAAPQEHKIEPGDYVTIEIIDTGHGMPQELMEKIFDPFFTTKETGEGTGLGLSTVYGIVQQTGGRIYVSSQENVGTKFVIFLKRHEMEEGEKAITTIEGTAKEEIIEDLTGSGTVLLVEDEDPVRIFSARALKTKGYNVVEADCGESGLRRINELDGKIDLVVTDVVMPGMTGPGMVETINARYPHIKVVFISGYGEDAFIKTYGNERKFNFLPKPFTIEQLATKVKEVMDK